ESETRFKALHNASFGGIAIHDNGFILECNNGLVEITGFAYEELIGMNGLLLISEDTRELVVQNISSGYERPYEAVGVRKNGERYPIRLEARNIPYKGKMVRVVEFRDQTEIKRTEKEKEELEKKLLQSQKMEAVGRLAGGVAHDFNNMLSVIIGHAELALSEIGADAAMRLYLEEIKSAGQRSAELTRQLLAFARQQTVIPRPIDLNECVAGMIRMLERLIGEDVGLLWLPGNEVWPLKIDPCQIDQILANLCVNARDAISDVGKIIIETGNSVFDETYCADYPNYMMGDYVYIAVSDTGCGMDAETLDHVFEPFFTTKESGKGTGLGLATVYGVIRQNNGFLDVYSEPGEGTLFKLYLPRYCGDDKPRRQQKVDASAVQSGRGTILLVEDEPMILRMTSKMLSMLGYQVLSASSPRDAVQQAQENVGDIDLLITDVVMPEMNGKDLAREIASFTPDLKWLFVSGYTANVIAQHGVLDEGVNFIQKPFSRAVLADKVRELIGR
nr:response regulator [Spirochaetales bacterium]